MISDEVFQADIIAKLKSITSVTALLPEQASGIKESQWQGDTFQYPAVRLDLERSGYYFDEQERCSLYRLEFSIYVFSQERSSKQCSQITGLIENAMTSTGFTGISGTHYQRVKLEDKVSAFRQDEHTWRSQLIYSTRAYPAQ